MKNDTDFGVVLICTYKVSPTQITLTLTNRRYFNINSHSQFLLIGKGRVSQCYINNIKVIFFSQNIRMFRKIEQNMTYELDNLPVKKFYQDLRSFTPAICSLLQQCIYLPFQIILSKSKLTDQNHQDAFLNSFYRFMNKISIMF